MSTQHAGLGTGASVVVGSVERKGDLSQGGGFRGDCDMSGKHVDALHRFVYAGHVKKKDLERALRNFGWSLQREGSDHEIWWNGEVMISVPRHREINELTAKSILRKAEKGRKK